jgi:hypothetical protein
LEQRVKKLKRLQKMMMNRLRLSFASVVDILIIDDTFNTIYLHQKAAAHVYSGNITV